LQIGQKPSRYLAQIGGASAGPGQMQRIYQHRSVRPVRLLNDPSGDRK
jgi:hypothetical protein